MKRTILVLMAILGLAATSASAQRAKPAQADGWWQGCVTVQNSTAYDPSYVIVFDRLTLVPPGTTVQICDITKR